MAKGKAGLPDGFDIGVTSADLAGPAALPGYLDDDPVLQFAKIQKEKARAAATSQPRKENPPPDSAISAFEKVQAQAARQPLEQKKESPAPLPNPQPSGSVSLPKKVRRRLQINLDAEGERMVEELLDLLSDQSSEHRIKVSEFVQALVLNLHNARSDISLGNLPQRGRWGSLTAKSFPVSLAEAFREAIVTHDQRIGGNQFKKAIGR